MQHSVQLKRPRPQPGRESDSRTDMTALANFTSFPRRLRGHYGTTSLQGRVDLVAPVMRLAPASTDSSLGSASPKTTNLGVAPTPEYLVAPALPATSEGPAADAAVIQVWEGTVLGVDSDGQLMEARLHAKIGTVFQVLVPPTHLSNATSSKPKRTLTGLVLSSGLPMRSHTPSPG